MLVCLFGNPHRRMGVFLGGADPGCESSRDASHRAGAFAASPLADCVCAAVACTAARDRSDGRDAAGDGAICVAAPDPWPLRRRDLRIQHARCGRGNTGQHVRHSAGAGVSSVRLAARGGQCAVRRCGVAGWSVAVLSRARDGGGKAEERFFTPRFRTRCCGRRKPHSEKLRRRFPIADQHDCLLHRPARPRF